MDFDLVVTFLARLSLILLFLPFSALDKVLNFDEAIAQAKLAVSSAVVAKVLILLGLFVEVIMSLGVITGVCDRLAAFILAGYCAVTALLWKPFWRQPDFSLSGQSSGREMFWDFLKNFAVAGGFLMVTFGPNAGAVGDFLHAPFSSTHPYSSAQGRWQP